MSDFVSHSQAGQDRFVYELLGPDFKGTFLDIGCSHPTEINNTYALEKLGWRGSSIDCTDIHDLYVKTRKSHFAQTDGTKLTFEHGTLYDYGSFDIDGATFDALENAITQGVKFRILTVEHDSYRLGTEMRDKEHAFLTQHGYTLICEDVCHEGLPFEDWWVRLNLVDESRALATRCCGVNGSDIRVASKALWPAYFDKVFVINLDRRIDRWTHTLEQLRILGLEAERFSGRDGVMYEGRLNGNAGCTASHRAILELVAYHKWPRTLVLEDDFVALFDDVPERFASMIREVPEDMDMLYLGGHYQEAPISRVSKHVIRCGGMLTTSSYVITPAAALSMAPHISGIGPIDNLFSRFARTQKHYIFQPRLFAQYTSMSDLCGETRNNIICMTDGFHEGLV